MLLVLLGFASARGSDGFELVREADGCEISMRPRAQQSPAAMRAVCDWPEIDPSRMVSMMADFERYPDFVFPIDVADVRRTDGQGRALVYQRQEMFGISDREVLLWMHREDVPGGARFVWTTAGEEPLTLRRGAIRTPSNDGYWQVTRREGGGARVVHEIAMQAGGRIPDWLVNLVRTRGFARVMSDVREVGARRGASARAVPGP